MFFRILKKEMKRKKGINVILFLFILLATIFVASSVNNILVVSNATDYCMEKGEVPDKYIYTFEVPGEKHLDDWLKAEGKSTYTDYAKNEIVVASSANIKAFRGIDGKEYDITNMIMVQCQWKRYVQVFDQNQNLLEVQDGQIGMQQAEMTRNGLKEGDTIELTFGNYTKEFTILPAILDPTFGGSYVGTTRFIVSENDYEKISENAGQIAYVYCVDTDEPEEFDRQMNKQGISIAFEATRDTFAFTYVISMVTAGTLIVVGLCLIIISFLVLRFTILFTIQEEYKEIGVMKAIGMQSRDIGKIYLVKYFVLSVVAAVIGCVLSIPVSSAMIKGAASNMMMQDGAANPGVNLLCSFVVLAVVLLFCNGSMNQLKKVSVMEAIRNGQNGERFRKKFFFSLHKKKQIKVPFFLAFNDILANPKRYLVLILTFAIGTILIILPLNTITSLSSTEMAKNFMLDVDADFCVSPDDLEGGTSDAPTRSTISNQMEQIKEAMYQKGYEVNLHTLLFYSLAFYAEDEENVSQYTVLQLCQSDGTYIELVDGEIPELGNEIAVTEQVMKKLNVAIGDTIHMKINDTVYDMLITGSYQNFMQMGESILLSENFDTDGLLSSTNWYFQGKVENIEDKTDLLNILKAEFPDYKLMDYKEAMDNQLGNTAQQISGLKTGIVLLICGINVLITVLMMKIFIMDETGQIAMLRSIGFSLCAVRLWQSFRMGIILVIGVLVGIFLSTFLNGLVLRPVFGMMGATHMKIQVNPLEAYLFYPMLLLLVILFAAYLSAGSIKKMNLMEINNIE